MFEEKEVRELVERIKAISESNIDYVEIYECTNMLLHMVFGDNDIFERDSYVSVDVKRIAYEIGMKIIPNGINDSKDEENGTERFYTGITVKNCYRNIGIKINNIYIDDKRHDDYMRLTIAIHIYYYLKYYYDEEAFAVSLFMPCKYNAMDEAIARIFARILLIRPTVVSDEFYIKYKGENHGFTGCERKWYEYLSIVARVPVEEAIIGWQEARIVLRLLDK